MKCPSSRAGLFQILRQLQALQPPLTLAAALALPASAHAADQVLRTVDVDAQGIQEKADGAVFGYVAKRSATGTKTDTPLLETPQSISVITADRIEAQRPRSINEALFYTPGIGSYGADTRSDFYMTLRGLGANFYMDGLALPTNKNYAGWRVDPYMVERLEVMRGPASVLYGQGEPGGIVNLVTKKPSTEQIREVQLQYGSLDRKQIAADVGDTLDSEGKWIYRVTGVYRDTDVTANPIGEEYFTIAPSLMWRPNQDTQLTVTATYLNQNTDTSAVFLPAIGTVDKSSGKISSKLYLGDGYFDQYEKEQYSLAYELQHRFNAAWTFRQNARYSELKLNNQTIYGAALFGTGIARIAAATEPDYKRFGIDNQLEGKIRTGDVLHTVLFGVDYQRQRTADPLVYGYASDADGNLLLIDINAPVHTRIDPQTSLNVAAENVHGDIDQTGAYLQDQIKFGRWSAMLSGRFDSAKTATEERLVPGSRQSHRDSAFTGRAGLVYQTEFGLAPYVSYATSFQPLAGTDSQGKAFDPTEGKQAEIGVKYQPKGTQHFVTLSAFDLRQQNVVSIDPADPFLRQRQTAEMKSRGLELEGALQFAEGFRGLVNATYMEVEKNKSSDPVEIGKWPVVVPRKSASAWADYTFPGGPLKNLGFGGGVRYSSETAGNVENTFYVPSYTVADATVFYTLMNWRLSVNVTNLFDKEYVVGCGGDVSCFYAPGRLVLGTVAYKW